eukprot:scaffold104593_cov69-Phaeocystis_antarctica.AAC.2
MSTINPPVLGSPLRISYTGYSFVLCRSQLISKAETLGLILHIEARVTVLCRVHALSLWSARLASQQSSHTQVIEGRVMLACRESCCQGQGDTRAPRPPR